MPKLTRESFLRGLADSYIQTAFISRHGGDLANFIDYCPPERLDAKPIAHLDDYFSNGTTQGLSEGLAIASRILYAFRQDAWVEYKDDSGITYTWNTMSELFDLAEALGYGPRECPVNRYMEWQKFANDLQWLITQTKQGK